MGLIVSENASFPCGTDSFRVLATDGGVSPLILSVGNCTYGLEKAHTHRNEDGPAYIMRVHATFAAESTRLLLPFVLIPKIMIK